MVLVHSPHIDAADKLVLANCYVFLTLYVLSYILSLYVFIIICYYRYIINQLDSKLCNSFNFITANTVNYLHIGGSQSTIVHFLTNKQHYK